MKSSGRQTSRPEECAEDRIRERLESILLSRWLHVFVVLSVVAALPFALTGASGSEAEAGPRERVGPTGGEFGSAPLGSRAERVAARPRPEVELLRSILGETFEERRQVCAGRFLADFETQSADLEELDPQSLKAMRTGNGWVLARGLTRSGGIAEVRYVRDREVWKLESVRVLDRRSKR